MATVNTHMTSGGETADHFLTVRNLKAAMDGLRDSQSSIVVDGEQRLQTAVIEEREADRQSQAEANPDSKVTSPRVDQILEIQKHPRAPSAAEDMYSNGTQ